MKKNYIFVLLAFLVLPFLGCCKEETKESIATAEQKDKLTNFSSVHTMGNHSYIPINIDGSPSEKILLILTILNDFEEIHPELEITHWHIEKQQRAKHTDRKIFGLWIDHKPKKQ